MCSRKICAVCGDESEKETYVVKEKMIGTLEPFTYFKCGRCGCLQIDEIPPNIGTYYQGDTYYPFSLSSRGNFIRRLNALRYSHRIRSIDGWDKSFSYFVGAFVEAFIPLDNARFLGFGLIKKQDRVLDVGSGAGELLYYMKDYGFENVGGIDLFIPADIEYPNGLKIKKGEIFDIPIDSRYDVIMFNHSLEHMTEPVRTLRTAYELLADDGKIIVRVPVCYFAWERYKENWFQIDAPRHFFLHTMESMKILAAQAGLAVEDVVFDSSHSQFMISRQYEKNIFFTDKRSYSRNVLKALFFSPMILYYSSRARKLNAQKQGDQCVFVMRKML